MLVLLPYIFGGLAKCNTDWLIHAQPVISWAPEMLESIDVLLHGDLLSCVDSLIPAHVDVVALFAHSICLLGCAFDLLIPFALLHRSPTVCWGIAFPLAAVCHLSNKARRVLLHTTEARF